MFKDFSFLTEFLGIWIPMFIITMLSQKYFCKLYKFYLSRICFPSQRQDLQDNNSTYSLLGKTSVFFLIFPVCRIES